MANSSLGGIGFIMTGEIVALDRRVGDGQAIAEGAADADVDVVRQVESFPEEIRAQVDPTLQRVAATS